ncbi:phage holin family protein [Puia dinghuensis]|uniref:Membrane protein n=1 Tax=Puia dinghuensis TaxID=1792502 RepID=A0A8J2UFQ3_9BACT|nr:phage holin family protein [Puia dinghuensis]GGB10256.1 membrane protein [Puia dinghuensis]
MNFLLRILITAVVAFALSSVLPGIHINTFWTAVVLSLVLAVLNFFLKPVLIILTLPITVLTFGLFLFVINALIVWFASESHLVRGFHVDGFGWALLFSLLLSLLTSLLYRDKDREEERRRY